MKGNPFKSIGFWIGLVLVFFIMLYQNLGYYGQLYLAEYLGIVTAPFIVALITYFFFFFIGYLVRRGKKKIEGSNKLI